MSGVRRVASSRRVTDVLRLTCHVPSLILTCQSRLSVQWRHASDMSFHRLSPVWRSSRHQCLSCVILFPVTTLRISYTWNVASCRRVTDIACLTCRIRSSHRRYFASPMFSVWHVVSGWRVSQVTRCYRVQGVTHRITDVNRLSFPVVAQRKSLVPDLRFLALHDGCLEPRVSSPVIVSNMSCQAIASLESRVWGVQFPVVGKRMSRVWYGVSAIVAWMMSRVWHRFPSCHEFHLSCVSFPVSVEHVSGRRATDISRLKCRFRSSCHGYHVCNPSFPFDDSGMSIQVIVSIMSCVMSRMFLSYHGCHAFVVLFLIIAVVSGRLYCQVCPVRHVTGDTRLSFDVRSSHHVCHTSGV